MSSSIGGSIGGIRMPMGMHHVTEPDLRDDETGIGPSAELDPVEIPNGGFTATQVWNAHSVPSGLPSRDNSY